MKQSSANYIIALFIFIICLLWTGAMVYMYLYKGLIIISVPFIMLSTVPVLGYTVSIFLLITGKEHSKVEKPFNKYY